MALKYREPQNNYELSVRIDPDTVCCGMARIWGIGADPYDEQDAIRSLIWNAGRTRAEAQAEVRRNPPKVLTANQLYQRMFERIRGTWADTRMFMLSDNVCHLTGVYNGSFHRGEISTWKFTEWLKKKKLGQIFEGPVTYNVNENSYVQMRIWVPPWADSEEAFPNFAEFEKASVDGKVYYCHEDEDCYDDEDDY